jgi:hypothetical protein
MVCHDRAIEWDAHPRRAHRARRRSNPDVMRRVPCANGWLVDACHGDSSSQRSSPERSLGSRSTRNALARKTVLMDRSPGQAPRKDVVGQKSDPSPLDAWSCWGSVPAASWPGVRRVQLQPLAAARPQHRSVGGFGSPGFASPRAPPAPCGVPSLEASRSRRDARGYCRSGPCGTTGTRVNGCRANPVRPHREGGTFLHNERTQRLGGPGNT